jgi:sporulation protein YlmC with PRC-barrel domain
MASIRYLGVVGLTIAQAVAIGTALAAQERQSTPQAQQEAAVPEIRNWDISSLYRNTWSADEMIGTQVRGGDGNDIGEVKDIVLDRKGAVTHVVVEVGGFLDIGDQHIGVPWTDVRIGRGMNWIQVPLREIENGTYSLYGAVPSGEDITLPGNKWRANELMGDYASLNDLPRFGLVVDLLFNESGQVQAVIVDRAAGGWGRGGWYAFPFTGYAPADYTHHLPYTRAQTERLAFDYDRLVAQSPHASNRRAQAVTGAVAPGHPFVRPPAAGEPAKQQGSR